MSDWPTIRGSADELLNEARAITGIDIIDEEAMVPLSILLDSYNRETRFTEEGAVMKRSYVLRILKNRLRMKRDLAAHPEILDIELLPPLLINSLPRTGSTKMQKTLAATGDFNYLPYWMCMNSASETGVPSESIDNRIADIQEYVNWFTKASPEVRFGHDMSPLEPEEEAYVLMQSLFAATLAGFATATDYVTWLNNQDQGIQYRYLRDTLKYLTWQGLADPGKPFLLKCVANLGLEAEIVDAFSASGVNLAYMHRNPLSVVPSASRLGRAFRRAYSDIDADMSGRPVRMAGQIMRSLKYRESHPAESFHDICYDKARTDMRSVIDGLYQYCGLTATDQTYENVARWESDNPKNKHGDWSYTAEEFGFTEEDIRREFAPYNDWIEAVGICNWTS